MSFERYKSFYAPDQKRRFNWKCPDCLKKLSTYIHTKNHPVNAALGPNKKNECNTKLDESYTSEVSVLGDTLPDESLNLSGTVPQGMLSPGNNVICIEQFEKLLDRKLDHYKIALVSEIKMAIMSEITTEISQMKLDITQNSNIFSTEQKNLKDEIDRMNNQICNLNAQNQQIQKELKEVQEKIKYPNEWKQTEHLQTMASTENCKKIIIFGLIEHYWETEHNLYDRVIHIFQDILNVNIAGYIEDLKRIGRKGPKRPIVVELLSKKMAKHLIQNGHFFKNTGLGISEFLDDKSLQEKRRIREVLLDARRNGHHAIFKDNILLIDGKIHEGHSNNKTTVALRNPSQESTNNHNGNVTEQNNENNEQNNTIEQNTTHSQDQRKHSHNLRTRPHNHNFRKFK